MQLASHRYIEKNILYPSWISELPSSDLSAIIVIPAFHELELKLTLDSLLSQVLFEGTVEVIVVLNDSESASIEIIEFHKAQLLELNSWASGGVNINQKIIFHFLHATKLPAKKAGVGLARKIGMDEAFQRWNGLGKTGPIVCLDADTLVEKNYLAVIIKYFRDHPKCPGVSIAYEHPLEDISPTSRKAIVLYELHLRYFLEAKKWTGFPFAFETIGSAMAVRSDEYAKQGGMNVRKAGEDFYFLNKFAVLPHFANLTATKVLPSARISERVPFGTGRAIGDMLQGGKKWMTYAPESIVSLKAFYDAIDQYYADPGSWKHLGFHQSIVIYLDKLDFTKKLLEIKKNTTSEASFKQRFFKKFDAFQIMKMLHHLEAQGMSRVGVGDAAVWLLNELGIKELESNALEDILMKYRILQNQ